MGHTVPAAGGGAGAAARPGQAHVVAVTAAQERLLDAVAGRGLGHLAHSAGVSDVVVQALGDQDEIGETEVDGEGNNGGHEASPDGAREVGDVADEPDGEEGDGNAIGRALLIVLD